MAPLEGIKVLDFSQFLAGPMATLRLADLGAQVIKVEKPHSGELSRSLDYAGLDASHAGAPFKSINRNKSSFAADLKDPADRERVRELIHSADVVVQNFRPGVAERLGFGFEQVKTLKPDIIYASFTGYGPEGPWRHLPGQDLLVQARSGLMWMSGDGSMPPIPIGISIVDVYGGAILAQGILAALLRKFRHGLGGHVETSLMEAAVDLQFQELGALLNEPSPRMERSNTHSGHPLLPAPYGVYELADGWIALAMMPLKELAESLELQELLQFDDPQSAYVERDRIKALIAARLRDATLADTLPRLEERDIWCAQVLDHRAMLDQVAEVLSLTQTVASSLGTSVATRCPIRLDGEIIMSGLGAPAIGNTTGWAAADQ